MKKIHDLGFVIGNHTKTHANLKQISEGQQKEEILTVSDTVEEVIGERPVFFRAPYGVNTEFSKALAKEDGMLLMNWSFGYDWEKKYMDADGLADIMVNTELLRDGANLLMHDREWTADALEKIVLGLRQKGYEFVDPSTI
jgi:peptidoglycan/xylan/chitin deacetylase (PgdA/CDA1 family)